MIATPGIDELERERERGAPTNGAARNGTNAIDAGEGDLRRLSEAAMGALLDANDPPVIFRAGTIPSWIERDDEGAPLIRALDKARVRHRLAAVAEWTKETRRDGRQPAHPPASVVDDILATPNPPFPVLRRIVEAPVFARDGSIRTEPGYDPAASVYFAPARGFRVPPVSERPTPEEIACARGLVLEPLVDFPFVGEADRAHAVALLWLPFLRELVDGPTPLHLIEKPAPGTGATLLVDTLAYPATGRSIATITEGRDEDEWRKRLTAKLISGPAIVLLDNLRRRLDSAALSAAITSPAWEDRILGQSANVRLDVRCAWVATGNNPSVSNEISRRTIRCRIDSRVDRPWQREGFRHADLRAWIRENRGRLVWAVLTLGRAWIAAGRPAGAAKPIGMFESWSRTIGGVLEIAGIDGFLANADEFYEEADTETAAWRALVEAWWERHGDSEVGVSDLWAIVSPEIGDGIDLDLGKGDERTLRTRLGKRLREQRDRRYGRLRIVAGGKRLRAQLWRLSEEANGDMKVMKDMNVFPRARENTFSRSERGGKPSSPSSPSCVAAEDL